MYSLLETFIQALRMMSFGFNKKNLRNLDWRISFGHDPSRLMSDWQSYLLFRVILLVSILITAIWSFAQYFLLEASTFYWFIYLTNWGLIIQIIYLSLAVYTTYRSKTFHHTHTSELPLFVKLMWLSYSIILPGSFMIFAMYWLLVFDGTFHPISILSHGLNFIVMALDTFFGSQPYLLFHGIYFISFAVVFLIWSYIHFILQIGNEQNGENYIYSSLNWQHPQSSIYFSLYLVFVITPIINLSFWLCVNKRDEHYKYAKTGSNDINAEICRFESKVVDMQLNSELLRANMIPSVAAQPVILVPRLV